MRLLPRQGNGRSHRNAPTRKIISKRYAIHPSSFAFSLATVPAWLVPDSETIISSSTTQREGCPTTPSCLRRLLHGLNCQAHSAPVEGAIKLSRQTQTWVRGDQIPNSTVSRNNALRRLDSDDYQRAASRKAFISGSRSTSPRQ